MLKAVRNRGDGSYHFFILTYIATLLLSFHYYFVTYINSTFLNQYMSEKNVGILYTAGSLINICIFFGIIRFLHRFGNYRVMLFCLGIEGALLLVLANATNIALIAPLFIIHHAITPILLLSLDIFLERYSKDTTTGAVRGIFLTVMSIAAVISPIIVGFILEGGEFSKIYYASASFIILLFILIYFYFRNYQDTPYLITSPITVFRKFIESEPIRHIFVSSLTLQIFFSWMIVYVPIYLFDHIGFGWEKIGLIISISILPFVLFEFPLGELADKRLGEKEILITGFIIMIVGILIIEQTTSQSILLWIIALGTARTGASFVEVAAETYFFKHINETNSELVNFWRMTNPLGFLIGSVLGSVSLIILPYQYAFFVLAFVVFCGMLYATKLKDTK